MGILETLAKSFPPERLLGMLNDMPDADLERSLRDMAPKLTPSKFLVFVRVMSDEMARRHPNVGAKL